MGFRHFRVLVGSGISYRSVPESLFKMGLLRTLIFFLNEECIFLHHRHTY